MSESSRKVLIVADPIHPGWWNARGRDLMTHTHRIPSVEALPTQGIAFHDDFAAEVRAALIAAGFRLVDAQGRAERPTPAPTRHHGPDHLRYVSDADDLTILPNDTPGGHWQDESATCPRCNPAHAATNALVRADALATIRANLARMKHVDDPPPTLFDPEGT